MTIIHKQELKLKNKMNIQSNKKEIPLEGNLEWWWYKAKSKLLKFIIINCNINDKNQILEIGPGKGNNLSTLKMFGAIDVLDEEIYFLDYLKKEKPEYVNNYYTNLNNIDKKYDLIILLDVIEHIKEPKKFLNRLGKILKKRGIIILGVPAYNFLWSVHDEKLNHYRRYTWKLIEEESKDFKIAKRYGFNYLLLPIRFLQVKFSKNIHTTNESSNLVNGLLYFITNIEFLFRKFGINPKFGISLYAVLKLK